MEKAASPNMRLNIFKKNTTKKVSRHDIYIQALSLRDNIYEIINNKHIILDSYIESESISVLEKIVENIDLFDDFELDEKMRKIANFYEKIAKIRKDYEELLKNTLINSVMLLNETKHYLNSTKIYPKPLLYKAQDLEDKITFWKNKHQGIEPSQIEEFKNYFDEYKLFFTDTKNCQEKLKIFIENKQQLNIDANILNQFIFDFQNGIFEKIKAR